MTSKQQYLPAPLSWVNIFSDIVNFDDLLADLKEEYSTQHIQITNPIISKLLLLDFALPPKIPHKPGLHSSKKFLNTFKIKLSELNKN